MKKRILYLILPIVTLILEILPYGAVCNFADGEGNRLRETFSYFDMVPFGYANFAPLITAILTCVAFGFLLIYCFTGGFAGVLRSLFCVCSVISLAPLVFGIEYFSVVGALITVSLAAEWLLLCFAVKPLSVQEYSNETNFSR
jgi:hypothetical protein